MKALLATTLLATVALVGCNSTKPAPMPQKPSASHTQHGGHQHNHMGHQHNTVQTFVCENDATPMIRTLNHDQIELTVDGVATKMNIAPAASGERYVSKTGVYGKGGEWHQKGNMAVFTYHGYGSPTNCQVR